MKSIDSKTTDLMNMLKSLMRDDKNLSPQDREVLLDALNDLLVATRNLNQQLGSLGERITRPKATLYLVK